MTIDLKRPGKVRVRIPDFVDAKDMKVKANRVEVKARAWGNYLELDERQAGERLEVTYPVILRQTELRSGWLERQRRPRHRNPGLREPASFRTRRRGSASSGCSCHPP